MTQSVFYVFMIVACFCLIGLLVMLGVPSEVAAILMMVFIIIAYFVWACKREREGFYNTEKRTFHLRARGPALRNHIVIKPYKHPSLKNNPAKLVYTGATVGGVTTGGFHVNEAYTSISGYTKTDKFELHYENKGVIDTIEASFDINDSPNIKKFKKGKNKLVLEKRHARKKMDEISAEHLQQALINEDYETASYYTRDSIIASKLTREDCERVLAWLCGED